MSHLELVPPLVEANHSEDLFKKSGQGLRTTFSPSNNSLAVYITEAVSSSQAHLLNAHLTEETTPA